MKQAKITSAFSLTGTTVSTIMKLSEDLGMNKSAVVAQAIEYYSKRHGTIEHQLEGLNARVAILEHKLKSYDTPTSAPIPQNEYMTLDDIEEQLSAPQEAPTPSTDVKWSDGLPFDEDTRELINSGARTVAQSARIYLGLRNGGTMPDNIEQMIAIAENEYDENAKKL